MAHLDSLKENLQRVRAKVEAACLRAGRDPDSVKLVAVTKNRPAEQITALVSLGATNLGENRVQELLSKYQEVPGEAKWHFIGHLQTNKVKQVLGKVALIHSLDRWSLAEEINHRAQETGSPVPVLLQVNVAGEDTKYGLAVEELVPFVKQVRGLEYLQVRGLMTIAPICADPEEVRPVFRQLRLLRDQVRDLGLAEIEMELLSMGMTDDYEVAVEEGANLVRIGRAIFEG